MSKRRAIRGGSGAAPPAAAMGLHTTNRYCGIRLGVRLVVIRRRKA